MHPNTRTLQRVKPQNAIFAQKFQLCLQSDIVSGLFPPAVALVAVSAGSVVVDCCMQPVMVARFQMASQSAAPLTPLAIC